MSKVIFFVLLGICLLAPDAQAKATCQTKPIIMFMTSWCPYCRKADAFFRYQDVEFEPIDIEKSNDPRIKTLYTGWGVPLIIVEGKTIAGYDPVALRQILCVTD